MGGGGCFRQQKNEIKKKILIQTKQNFLCLPVCLFFCPFESNRRQNGKSDCAQILILVKF